ncbi:MAG: enoyl-CoA hydratase [Actinobacteria bacterium]|nr:enoyl-CoA hydratase [Actinomycetota bacterium]
MSLQDLAHEHVHVTERGHVVTVTLDNPASRNGCTGDMWVHLGEIFRHIGYSGARVAILTGANGDFCAGADLSSAAGGTGDGEGAPTTNQLAGMRVLGDAMLQIHNCVVPVIAKVDGVCVGAGLGLALCADMVWASDRARFSAIFAKRGLSLDFGTSWLLRQRVGVHLAKQIALTAEMIPATRAYEHYRLINEVVPADELDARVDEVAATIAGGPPIALSMTKRQIDNGGSSSLLQALEVETLAQNVNIGTSDMQEAFMAFFEKRPPNFEGR